MYSRVSTTTCMIYYERTNMKAADAKALASVLRTTKGTILNVDTNDIGDEGFVALVNALSPTITCFYADSNRICDAGAVALADVLRTNTTLTDVNLWGNCIGDAGAFALADALHVNTTVHLNLARNNIFAAAKRALAVHGTRVKI